MILTSVFTGLLGTATSALQMKINRLALGLAEAPLPVAMLSTINHWFPPVEKGTAVGMFLAAAKFGPVLVPPIGAVIIASLGWHYIFYFCAIPGLLFSVAWYFLVANDPAQSRFTSASEVEHIRSRPPAAASGEGEAKPADKGGERKLRWLDRLIRARSVRPIATAAEIFRSPNVWGLALGYLLMTGIINVILAWLPTYLTTVKKLSIMNVGFVAAAPFVGGVLGNLIGGWFSDRIVDKRRKPTIIITALSSVFMMYALIHAPNEVIPLGLLLLVTGLLLNLGYSSFTVYPAGLTTKETYPLAVSVVNTGGQAGGAVFPFLTGLILDSYSWDAVFLFLAASSLVALGHVPQDGVIDWVVMCCLGLGSGGFQGKRRLAADLVGAEAGHGLERHVAVLELPLVVLLHQDGSDEAQDAGLVREDADHVGAALDLLVEAFERVGRMQLGPVRAWEVHEGQDIGLGLVHGGGELRPARAQLVGDLTPDLAAALAVLLEEHGADGGRDHAVMSLGHVGQHVAHEVDAAALPGRLEHLGDRRLEALVGVRDDQLDAGQAALLQAAQEAEPEGGSAAEW